MKLPPKGSNAMETVFHMGKDSDQHLREFAEKSVDFAVQELRDCGADELKALLRTLKDDNRTFERKDTDLYN